MATSHRRTSDRTPRSHGQPTHGHTHGGDVPDVEVGGTAKTLLLMALVVVAVATIVGGIRWWPDDGRVDEIRDSVDVSAPGVTLPEATVISVQPPCDPTTPPGEGTGAEEPACGFLLARPDDAATGEEEVQVRVAPEVATSGLQEGDRVRLVRVPPAEGAPADTGASYSYGTALRNAPLGWLALGFALLVLAVARVRGLMALIGLAISGVVIWRYLLPALLSGQPGTGVALVTAAAIMYVVLYSTHGVSWRTSTALGGTLAGVGATALIGYLVIDTARLTGVADETGGALTAAAGTVSFQGLLQCGVIIASLGVLNDVTITQASAVWELRSASQTASRRRVYLGAMRIGRDHIASTIYTIVFAYAGTALLVLLLLLAYDQPFMTLVSSEDLAEEIARTLTSGIGVVLAVPLTTALAAVIAAPVDPDPGATRPEDRDHASGP